MKHHVAQLKIAFRFSLTITERALSLFTVLNANEKLNKTQVKPILLAVYILSVISLHISSIHLISPVVYIRDMPREWTSLWLSVGS